MTRREAAALAVMHAVLTVKEARSEWLAAVDESLTGTVRPADLARLSGEKWEAYHAAGLALEEAEAEFGAAVAAEAEYGAAAAADRGTWAYRPGMQGPGGYGTVPREYDD